MKKPPTQSEITASLTQLRNAMKHLGEAREAAATIERDIGTFNQTIGEIGSPQYTDSKAVQVLAAARIQLELAQQALEEAPDRLEDARERLAQAVEKTAAPIAIALLKQAMEKRLEAIVSVLSPFCSNRASAEVAAKMTDVWLGGAQVINGINTQSQSYNMSHPAVAMRVAQKLEGILSVAATQDGHIEQLLPMLAPTEPTTEAD